MIDLRQFSFELFKELRIPTTSGAFGESYGDFQARTELDHLSIGRNQVGLKFVKSCFTAVLPGLVPEKVPDLNGQTLAQKPAAQEFDHHKCSN
jgi:hypothetical protein